MISRAVGLLFLGLTVTLASGCVSSGKPKGPDVDVKGTVTFNGKPLAEGQLMFTAPAQPIRTFDVKDGAFSGKAYPGKNQVEAVSYKLGPPIATDPAKDPTKTNILPHRYMGPGSGLSADVTAGAANDFKFALTSP